MVMSSAVVRLGLNDRTPLDGRAGNGWPGRLERAGVADGESDALPAALSKKPLGARRELSTHTAMPDSRPEPLRRIFFLQISTLRSTDRMDRPYL